MVLFALVSTKITAQVITECPAQSTALETNNFTALECKQTALEDYVMSGPSVWVTYTANAPESWENEHHPIGLYVSGYMSSRAFINGVSIGENGI